MQEVLDVAGLRLRGDRRLAALAAREARDEHGHGAAHGGLGVGRVVVGDRGEAETQRVG